MSTTPLKQIVIKNSFSIKNLAQECNISSSYLSLILNGHRTNIDEKIIGTLALKLKIPEEEIKFLLIPQERNGNSDTEENLLQWLNNLLDLLEADQKEEVKLYTNLLFNVSNLFPLAQRFTEWYRGWLLTLDNRFDDALVLFEKAKHFQTKSSVERRFKAKVFSSIGGALVAKGRYKEAIKAFRNSLFLWDKGKQVALVYLNMGTLYRRSHQYNRAIDMYQKAIDYGPNSIKISALSSLAQVAFDRNDLLKARTYILRGYWASKAEVNPKGKDDLYCNMGIYFSLKGELERAKRWLKKSLSVNQQTKNRRTKQFAISELISIHLLEGNEIQADYLISNLLNEQSDNNDSLSLANSLCVFAKRLLNSQKYKESYLILSHCQKILNNLLPSHEQIECYSLLKKYYQAIKEPFQVELYRSELKYLKTKIK